MGGKQAQDIHIPLALRTQSCGMAWWEARATSKDLDTLSCWESMPCSCGSLVVVSLVL